MARRYYYFAALLVLVGVVGFFVRGPLVGVFETTAALNIIHIVSGVTLAIAATRGLGTMRACGRMLGYVFAGLAIAAFAADANLVAGLLPLSDSNAWFHLMLSLVLLYHALLAPPTL